MHYPIPVKAEEIIALRHKPVDEEMVAVAIAGVVKIARSQGRSLDELTAEVLEDDLILDAVQRGWLSQIVTQAWYSLP
ncbi:MAG: hypothetical protein AB4058_03875 [Microcystaceae cyanobacterium]